jgi:lipopolysaccharide heptosyltransferase II
MQKFLVVNMNYMGDALLTTPAIAALRRANPGARIDTVVGAGAAADVLRDNPNIDQVIARTERGSWGRCMQLYKLLREGEYTDVIVLPALPAYALAAFLAGTPVRTGAANRGMNQFLTHLRHSSARHMADVMLDTVPCPPEARPDERRLTVAVSQDTQRTAQLLLSQVKADAGTPIVAINVGATRPQKRWTAEGFARTIEGLKQCACVLVGAGRDDAALAEEIDRLLQGPRATNLIGKTDVKQLAALLSRCDVLVTADSGSMHLAVAVGTPTVALFGSTDPEVTGPYDDRSRVIYKKLNCAPCLNHPTCGGRFDCMGSITPDEVVLVVRDLLREKRGSSVPLPALRSLDLDTSTSAPRTKAPALAAARWVEPAAGGKRRGDR